MAFFSFLGPLIYYSNELKPYSCDVVASLAITLAVLRWTDNPHSAVGHRGRGGAIGVFFSFPAVFVLAGAGIWMFTRRWAARGQARGGFAIWAAAFALNYLIFLRPFTGGEAHPHLVQYWIAQNAFMPHAPVDAVEWIFSNLVAVADNPAAMWLDYPDAALIGLIVGGVAAAHRPRRSCRCCWPPCRLSCGIGDKTISLRRSSGAFFVPQYLLLIAAGLESLWTNLAAKAAALAIAGCILIPSAQRTIGYLLYPSGREESLPVYRWVASHYRPGDVVYLSHFAELSFHFYESQSGWPDDFPPPVRFNVQPAIVRPSKFLMTSSHWRGSRVLADPDTCRGRRI